MDGQMTVSRRRPRSGRITAALGLLAVASLVMAGSLVTGDTVLLGAAGVLAVVGGWVALRLAWSTVLDGRFEHAADRARLTRTYRALFAERAVEQQEFIARLATRLAQRDRALHDLRGSLAGVELRAVEAETTLSTYRRRLTDAEARIVSMGDLITRTLMEQQAARRAAGKPPLLGPKRTEAQRGDQRGELREQVVPEWADLAADPVAALVAWEEHAGHLAGRHTAQSDTAGTADTAGRARPA